MLFLLVLIVALITLLIGSLVLIKNPHSKFNIVLFIHSVFVMCWMLTNYFSNSLWLDNFWLRAMNHLVLFFGSGVVLSLNYFVELLTNQNRSGRLRKIYYTIGIIGTLAALTPLVVTGIERGNELAEIKFGIFGALYFTQMIFFILRLFWLIIKGIRNSSGMQKARIQTVGIGVFGAFGVLIITNVFLPFVFGSFNASVVAPLIFVLMVAVLAYTIIWQQLFSISRSILRAFGYVMTLFLAVVMYVFILNLIQDNIVQNNNNQTINNIYLIIFIAVAILAFQPLRKWIEVVSAKLFLRDSYDSKNIDEISDIFIANQKNEKILIKKSFQVINRAMKASYIAFVTPDNNDPTFLVGKDSSKVKRLPNKIDIPLGVYFRKDLTPSKLDEILAENNIDLIFELSTAKKHIGYVVFGPKKNGGSYTKQDYELLRTIRKNLAIAIQNAQNFQEILTFSDVLQAEVERATQDLKKTNQELKKTSVAKDEFISMASHQIRPQLAAVRGFVDLLGGSKINHSQQELLNWTSAGVERIIRIIADMLNLSKISSGELSINPAKVDLVQMVNNEIHSVKNLGNMKNCEIITSFSKKRFIVSADEIKLREVIANFLNNAVEYSLDKSKIEIRLFEDDNDTVFSVRDYGIGVSDKDSRKLFAKYFRASNAVDVRPSGTGVGLFLARKVVEAHNGQVFYEKPSDEKLGSIFGFRLKK